MFRTILPAGLLLAVAAAVSFADVQPPHTQNPQVVEMIVAKVNGEIITKGELEQQRARVAAELQKENPLLTGEQLRTAVDAKMGDALRDKIDQLLLVQKAKELNINVDPEVTRQIATIQAQTKELDPEKFKTMVSTETGMPFEDYKNMMRDSLLTRKVVSQEVAYKIQLPQSELRDYYEKHKTEFVRKEQVFLQDILIAAKADTPDAWAAAEKKAKEISARARKGEKFTDLVHSYSDAESAAQDGQLPPYERGQLRKEIEDSVFKANRGYVTDPIRTPNGYEIFKVLERYDAGQAAFEDVQNEIMDKMYEPRIQPELRKYLTKLRQDAFIEIRGGYVDSGAAPGKDTAWMDPATLQPETTTKEEVLKHRKKKMFGVIPKFGSEHVSSSQPGNAPKMPKDTSAATPATGTNSSSSSAAPAAGSSSSSSSTPAVQ